MLQGFCELNSMNTFIRHNKQTLKEEEKMKSKKEHNNKTAYMHTYTYVNSRADSERTLQSIFHVVFEIIKYYIS